MTLGRLGWTLLGLGVLTYVVTSQISLVAVPPNTRLLLLMSLALLIFAPLLGGQLLLLIAHRRFFERTAGVLLCVALLFGGLTIYAQPALSTHSLVLVQLLHQLLTAWLLTFLFVAGLILAVHLLYRDRSVLFTGAILLVYVWGVLLYLIRTGPEPFLTRLFGSGLPPVLTGLTCLTLWLVPLGMLSFVLHSARIIAAELRPQPPDKQRSSL